MMVRRAKPTNRPMILELCHAYLVPPHCSASNRQTIVGMRIDAPIRSSFLILCTRVRLSGLFALSM